MIMRHKGWYKMNRGIKSDKGKVVYFSLLLISGKPDSFSITEVCLIQI